MAWGSPLPDADTGTTTIVFVVPPAVVLGVASRVTVVGLPLGKEVDARVMAEVDGWWLVVAVAEAWGLVTVAGAVTRGSVFRFGETVAGTSAFPIAMAPDRSPN